ncbi:MAG: hypothetical protein GY774_21170 [Planctomycetes bacterium]|nr:hypothetical protein [Planctomycetota bacterium]
MKKEHKFGLDTTDMLLLWIAMILWLSLFLVGTLVNSEPYRKRFGDFEGGIAATIGTGLIVLFTYTLTNVAFLCILGGVLGVLGTKAILVSDAQAGQEPRDTTSPRNSAIIRGFVVYLTVIAGVLILGNDPAQTTQLQYVRLAGLMSIAGFVVNYRPAIFGQLLQRAGSLIEQSTIQSDDQGKD